MSEAMIAGKPVEFWEGLMDSHANDGGGDIAGITAMMFDGETEVGQIRVTDGRMPNDFRGIRADGTRIESQQLVRAGVYGEWPGKWAAPKSEKTP